MNVMHSHSYLYEPLIQKHMRHYVSANASINQPDGDKNNVKLM